MFIWLKEVWWMVGDYLVEGNVVEGWCLPGLRKCGGWLVITWLKAVWWMVGVYLVEGSVVDGW